MGLSLGLASSCADTSEFSCQNDDDCSGGSCVDSFCAFPDAGCDSQLAYGQHAGQLAGECVPLGGTGTSVGTSVGPSASSLSATSGPPDGDSTDGGVTGGPSTDPSTGLGTTSPVTASATDSVGEPTTTGDGTDTGGESTGPPVSQMVELVVNGSFGNGDASWNTDNNPDTVAGCSIGDDPMITFGDAGGYMYNGNSVGPSAHVLYQDFTVPANVVDATFSIEYAQSNPEALDPDDVQTIIKDCLDENGDGNNDNAFRIDLVDDLGDVFTTPIQLQLGAPVTAAGDPTAPVFVNLTVSDAALLAYLQSVEGETIRLRIAQVESTFPWEIALDDVSLVVETN